MQSTGDREKECDEVAELIELDFQLAGSSAIEDKLQVNVGQTIADLKTAGIKVWVLTGDKVETAINIGQSCQLLTKKQNWFQLKGEPGLELLQEIVSAQGKVKSNANKSAVIVDGS
jgi:magnesium-transporting ATPase (P-type)